MSDPYATEVKRFFKERPIFVRASLMLFLLSTEEDQPVLLPPFDPLRVMLNVWTPEPVPPFGPGALKRVMRELKDYQRSEEPRGFSMGPVDEDDMSRWKATILGPEGSPYEGGLFHLNITIPKDYPFKPPRMQFTTKVFHPNISECGYVSINILSYDWSPALTISKAVVALRYLLENPDPSDYMMPEAARLLRKDRKEYDDMVKLWTKKYAS